MRVVDLIMRSILAVMLAAGCAAPLPSERDQRVIDTLADDNYVWANREPALVKLKLRKMQRGPYEWLRGTNALYWRDLTEPGAERITTAFGDEASSRVLLVGDPHPENVGTFRAGDGTMIVDWNDLDAAGYGPFTADVRRLAIGMLVATERTDDAEIAGAVATGYLAQMSALASGAAPMLLSFGAHPLLDKELKKAQKRGDVRYAVDEIAPISGDTRYLAFGELEPIADDGVYEDHVGTVGADMAAWIDDAVAQWAARRGEQATVKLRARRIGSGVASYAALRFNVVLEGPTAAPSDDVLIELKEERDGIVVHGVPQLHTGEWMSPAARVVDAQRRLQCRRDADTRLGFGDLGGLSLKIRDREAYQRGLDHGDIAKLDRSEQLALATELGALLASAHGNALTQDGARGWTVIAPVVSGREAAFEAEMVGSARDQAAQVVADHAAFAEVDLGALVIP